MPYLPMMTTDPVLFWTVACLSVFFLSISKSGFGGALASMSVPIMLFVMSPTDALAVLLPLFILTSVGVFFIWYKHCNWRIVSVMCLFAAAGQVVGWLLFDYFTENVLQLLIGFVAVSSASNYALNLWRGQSDISKQEAAERSLWRRASVWCGLSGVSSFVSLSGGIPAQIFLLPHRLPKEAFVGSFSVYFMVIDLLKVPLFAELDVITLESLRITMFLLPVAPIGVLLGWWLNKRINDRIFYHISYSALMILGIKLLADVALAT